MQAPSMKYNPAFLTDKDLIDSFVARHSELRWMLDVLRENTGDANQHILLIGPRGIGKTTLVLRVAAEIRQAPDLQTQWYPVVYGEESYRVTSPGEFWLEALFHIAEKTGLAEWKQTYETLLAERNEDRLRERALAQLMDFADSEGKRLLLVVENLHMLIGAQMNKDDAWTLRHTLMNESRLMLLSTATNRFAAIENYNEALHGMFRVIDLDPLEDREAEAIWEAVTGSAPQAYQIRPIQILTGGNPRLIRIISEFAARTSFQELMTNLIQLVDEHTEYFKYHLDTLAPQERKVFVSLADLWDPSTARAVSEEARLDVSKTSALLARLVQRGAVVVSRQEGRTKYYQLAERMYNIYHLMRRSNKANSRIQAVVRFMVHLYQGDSLVHTTTALAREALQLLPAQRMDHYNAFEEILRCTDSRLQKQIIAATAPIFENMADVPVTIRELLQTALPIQKTNLELDILEAEETTKTSNKNKVEWLDRGMELYREGDPEAALKVFQSGLEVASQDAFASLMQATTLMHLGRDEAALRAFEHTIKLNPKLQRAWAGRGLVLLNLDRYKESALAFESALKLEPKDGVAWYGLGEALTNQYRYEEALIACNHALEIYPDFQLAWRSKGTILSGLDHDEEALAAYERALAIDSNDVLAMTGKGFVLQALGRYEEALKILDDALEREPQNGYAWLLKSDVLEYLERYEEAFVALEHAINLGVTDNRTWTNKGIALVRLGRYEEALAALEHAIELGQADMSTQHMKGVTLFYLGRYEEALVQFEHILELDPTHEQALILKASILLPAGQYEAALKTYDQIIVLNPDKWAAWRFKGLALTHLGRTEEALAAYKQADDLHPNDPEILDDMARVYFSLGTEDDIQQATHFAERAVELSPETSAYRFILAVMLSAEQRWTEALEEARLFLNDSELVASSLDNLIKFSVSAAAAGYASEMLRLLEESSNAEALEPLIVALQLYLDKQIDVALEIEEVAKDVVKRIEAKRAAYEKEDVLMAEGAA